MLCCDVGQTRWASTMLPQAGHLFDPDDTLIQAYGGAEAAWPSRVGPHIKRYPDFKKSPR